MTRLVFRRATEFFTDTFRGVPYEDRPSVLLAPVWFWSFQFSATE